MNQIDAAFRISYPCLTARQKKQKLISYVWTRQNCYESKKWITMPKSNQFPQPYPPPPKPKKIQSEKRKMHQG